MSWQTTIFLMFIWSVCSILAYFSKDTSLMILPTIITAGYGAYKANT